jgi:hypothetical protein
VILAYAAVAIEHGKPQYLSAVDILPSNPNHPASNGSSVALKADITKTTISWRIMANPTIQFGK